jgi:RNA polymerase-interacting CarD/CdnL/TRCF family regulator
MNFHSGDTVMHWMHGLGTIVRLEKRAVLGTVAQYYAVEVGGMTVWVPADEHLKERLRPPTSKAQFKRLIADLSTPGEPLPPDRHDRKLLVMEVLREGSAESLARVIRALVTYQKIHPLNDSDQAQLKRAESSFLAEWGHILSITPQQADAQMHRLLAATPA